MRSGGKALHILKLGTTMRCEIASRYGRLYPSPLRNRSTNSIGHDAETLPQLAWSGKLRENLHRDQNLVLQVVSNYFTG
jgi:hypothetical protein